MITVVKPPRAAPEIFCPIEMAPSTTDNISIAAPRKVTICIGAVEKDVILEIEIQGALKVKKKFPDTLLLFVTPPSVDVLRERLIGRGTEDAETVKKRLGRAVEEADGVEEYDYLVVNDDLDTCVEEVHSIIQAEKLRVSRNINFINEIKSELKGE